MKPVITSSTIATIDISSIRPSHDNPRGAVQFDSSFQRLAASIKEVGILVPLVVRELPKPEGQIKYELVDGERRFRAASAVRRDKAPAHIVKPDVDDRDLRQFMFHLHMTREQWEPLAQVKSLSEMYTQTDAGIPITEKARWAKDIAGDTSMDSRTANDRVHLLSWPKDLREQIYSFAEKISEENEDIYSYVLALEASVIEPAYKAFKDSMGPENQIDEKLNRIRKVLLKKLLEGLSEGRIHNRDQIRDLKPLFHARLQPGERKEAKKIFDDLSLKVNYTFDDAKTDLELKLPELLAERPATPRRVIALMKSLTEILSDYRKEYINASSQRESTRKKTRSEFMDALKGLLAAAKSLQGKM